MTKLKTIRIRRIRLVVKLFVRIRMRIVIQILIFLMLVALDIIICLYSIYDIKTIEILQNY